MEIRILGSSSSEGWPALWCGCETCRRARGAGGKNLRTRSSILLNDVCRVDLPPDAYCQMAKHNLDLSGLKRLFFTHTHADHFAPDQLQYIVPPFAFDRANEPLEVYGTGAAIGKLRDALGDLNGYPIEAHEVQPYEPVKAGEFVFTPVLAPHKPDDRSLNYVVESEGRAALYACDTGPYDERTRDYLSGVQLHCVICEFTNGFTQDIRGHMGLADVLELRDTLVSCGSIASGCRIILTHLCHTIGMLHEEIERAVSPYGLEVAYDGMRVTL